VMVTIRFSTDTLVKEVKRVVRGVALFATVIALAGACGGAVPNSKEQQYMVDIAACSASAQTKSDAMVCRRDVNYQYGLCQNPAVRVTPCDEPEVEAKFRYNSPTLFLPAPLPGQPVLDPDASLDPMKDFDAADSGDK